jgi:antitoxin component of MazEF toxin-antitoxin module
VYGLCKIQTLTPTNTVYTIVYMNKYTVTVIKTGNSYALRVPKRYVEDAQLKSGQKTTIALPIPEPKQNRERIQEAIRKLQEIGAYNDIKDPIAWQREIRKDRPLPGRE